MAKYLSEEIDDTTRQVVIGVSALTGYLFGLRGGFFRRITYASAGALAMCSLCYPNQTYDYAQEAITQSKHYSLVAYNFVYGVSVNKEKPDIEFPQIPSSVDEVKQVFNRLSQSAFEMFSDRNQKSEVNEEVKVKKEKQVKFEKPDVVIQDSYDGSMNSCDCPIDSCMGRHENAVSD